MDFLNKTDEELAKLSQDYYKKYGQYLEDKTLSVQEKSLETLFKKNKVINVAEEKKELFAFLKESLFRQLKQIAIVEYLIMEKNNDFGTMGEQRVSISFCRNLLNIPNDREVTQFDADRFRRIIDETDEKLNKKSGDSYKEWLKRNSFDFIGIKINISEPSILKKYLEDIKFEFYFYCSFQRKGMMNFIFGEAETKKVGEIEVAVIKKEFIRSPNLVLSVAAKGGEGNSILIRRESCEVIFFNKWQKFFEQSKLERKKSLNHPNSAIREGVKEKALALYKVKNTAEVKNIKKKFINEMIDGILWHEIGHKVAEDKEGIPYNQMLSVFVRSDKIIGVLNECLGDWAPRDGKRLGAIERFMEIAEKDVEQATRCIYVYLSDNWFVDEEEEFMALQTDILTALILHFIEKDGSVNFTRMKKEHAQIYQLLEKKHVAVLDHIFSIIKKAKYEVGIHQLDYTGLEKEIFKIYKDSNTVTNQKELYAKGSFWVNLMGYVGHFSPATERLIDDYIETASKEFAVGVLKIITKNNPEKYNNSLREYIYQKYREIGVLKERKKVDYVQAVDAACNKIKMPEKVAEKVKEQFKNIIENGKNYDISISYEGKPDPFIAIVQEMMLKTGFGDIESGMALGELYDPEEPADKRKEYLKNELEGIRDQIESEMYLEVDVLKVNKDHKILPVVEDLVSKIDFLDGKKLSEKIKKIEYAEKMAPGVLFEVFVPLKRGYMDWNTSQAVWRINQDLRPDEFIMQWTIDREFLEVLVETY